MGLVLGVLIGIVVAVAISAYAVYHAFLRQGAWSKEGCAAAPPPAADESLSATSPAAPTG